MQDDRGLLPFPGGARNSHMGHLIFGSPVVRLRILSRPTPNAPKLSGTDVAEDGAVAAGQYRRHPSTSLAEPRVPDGINTAVNAVQSPGMLAIRDAAGRKPCIQELWSRDHAVLSCGDPGNCGVRRGFVAFLRHIRRKATIAAISPPGCRSGVL